MAREKDPYKRNPVANPCACKLHVVPAGVDGVRWYWGYHSRIACMVSFPDRVCWCGRTREQHQNSEGHDPTKTAPSEAAVADEWKGELVVKP